MHGARSSHLSAFLLAFFMSFLGAGTSAPAAVPAPGLTIASNDVPSVLSAEHNGTATPDALVLTVANAGSVATNGTITIIDTLPAALTATGIEGNVESSNAPLSCALASVSCSYGGVLRPGETLLVRVQVTVAPGATGSVTNTASVQGGGALGASTSAPVRLGSAAQSLAEPFGIESFAFDVTGLDGLPDTQAGDHPFENTVSFALNSAPEGRAYPTAGGLAGGEGPLKDLVFDLPQGFLGNPEAVAKCPQYKVSNGECPAASQIGISRLLIDGLADAKQVDRFEVAPIYNVVPDRGYPAQFEFTFGFGKTGIPVTLYATVDPDTNYGVRVTVPDIQAAGKVTAVSDTFFGTPLTDPDYANENLGAAAGAIPFAFLENPTGCTSEPQDATVSADSWQHPGELLPDGAPNLSDGGWVTQTTTVYPQVTGCELLQFSPSLEVLPETSRADEPTGLTVNLAVPQAPEISPDRGTPALKAATVTLPSGLSVNPSAADGLQGCGDAQFAALSSTPGTCPQASVLATATATTPLLGEPLTGQVFLGTPECDPCSSADASDGRMFRLFLEVADSGVVIKEQGRIYANPTTGQLTTTFTGLPQEPVSHIQLRFKGGLRAGLATPQTCGAFTSTSDLMPWSTPVTPDATPSSEFGVDWDGNGGACPASIPFAPSFSAGTSNPNAGQFSPLTVTIGREDREQDIADIQVTTPPGLSGILTGVPLCGEPQADLGTCSEASRIGTMTVAAGAGGHPFYEQGSLYLTGPYDGAPFGLSIVVPTVAGPFNLGNVVVRARINVNPVTTALTVTSDPLPQVIDGIPLRLRTTNVTVGRPGFIFNPTSCAQQHIEATLTGARGGVSHESVPFAVSGCAGLHFGPTFKVSTSGKTSKADGASLDARVTYPSGAQSNIASVKVDLPKQLPSRLTTLQKACTEQTFEANPAACPGSSLIGVAKASTPELPVPLIGPAYFVSHGGAAFPDLEIVLEGYGVRVDLTAATFISKKGITSSTFKTVPDAPVNSFELYLPEGRYSALTANGNLCKQAGKLKMPTLFTAQDGAQFKAGHEAHRHRLPQDEGENEEKGQGEEVHPRQGG